MINDRQHDAGKWVTIASKIEDVSRLLNDADLRAGFPVDDGMNKFREWIYELNLEVFALSQELIPAAMAKFRYVLNDSGEVGNDL